MADLPPASGSAALPLLVGLYLLAAVAVAVLSPRAEPCPRNIDEPAIADAVGPTHAATVRATHGITVFATELPPRHVQADIEDVAKCRAYFKTARYSSDQLLALIDLAFAEKARRLGPAEFGDPPVFGQIDGVRNRIVLLTPQYPFPQAFREAVLRVVPADAVTFKGGMP